MNLCESGIGSCGQFLDEELPCRIEVHLFVNPLPLAVPGLPGKFPVSGAKRLSIEHLYGPELNDRIEPVLRTLDGILHCRIGPGAIT